MISSPKRSWYEASSRRASCYSLRPSLSASQLIAHVILSSGQPVANLSARADALRPIINSFVFANRAIGSDLDLITRTTETWVKNRPRMFEGRAAHGWIAMAHGTSLAPSDRVVMNMGETPWQFLLNRDPLRTHKPLPSMIRSGRGSAYPTRLTG